MTFRMCVSYGLAFCFIVAALNANRTIWRAHTVSDVFADALTAFVGYAFLVDGNRVRRHLKERRLGLTE
jgi:hypothetical protein